MAQDATPRDPAAPASGLVARVAILAAALGVLATWTSDGPVHLDGLQGPNNGWLVLILAAFALAWRRSMTRGSRLGAVGVLGSAAVIGWTALAGWRDGRDVVGATAGFGLLLVLAAAVALGVAALARR